MIRPRLFTARYANKTLVTHPAAKVQTSLGAPRFRLPYRLAATIPELAPAGWMLHLDEAKFAIAYGRRLDRLGVDHVRRILDQVASDAGGDQLALLCFERLGIGVGCHRRTFAAWWFEQTGQVVEEIPEDEDRV